jgi:hypothetical protein
LHERKIEEGDEVDVAIRLGSHLISFLPYLLISQLDNNSRAVDEWGNSAAGDIELSLNDVDVDEIQDHRSSLTQEFDEATHNLSLA